MMTSQPWSLDNIAALRETDEVEVKLAAGRDGKGEVPADFWPTYSAFANGAGGYIVLGVRERDGTFALENGIPDPERLRNQIFDLANNPQKVSANLLAGEDVETVAVDGRSIVIVRVPPASRRHKPVYIGGNPMKGTYRRLSEGDRLCDAETVKRMLADMEDTRDDRVLKGFSLSDLSIETVDIYRRLLADRTPNHPFLDNHTPEFLQKIRAWRTDRESGTEGVTVAGLLMFGRSQSIADEFPNYALDYQERDDTRTTRWVDRLTNDGQWSGNLFDFYRLVLRKLYAGLKTPFQLIDGIRQDETSAHEALREALVNTLVHADFMGRASILVVRRPDMFGFRNPGGMRIPVELAIRGGESDGRNRTLQQMFLLVGAGERAGSGVPRIHKGWREQHWRPPSLFEKQEPSEQTLLSLQMADLLPSGALEQLRKRFGAIIDTLSPDERVVLATSALETTVSHARAMTLCDMHPTDMTRLLQRLVHDDLLEKVGQGRGTRYHLPGAALADPDEAFVNGLGLVPTMQKSSDLEIRPSELSSEHTESNSEGSRTGGANRAGRMVQGLDMPLIDSLADLGPDLRQELERSASVIGSGRVPRDHMEAAILSLCTGRYITLRTLASLLQRADDYLRQGYLNPLVKQERIRLAFPHKPNDPRQAYSSV